MPNSYFLFAGVIIFGSMNEKLDLKFLLHDTRARVYLLWAVIVAVGYVSTHYYQNKNINFVWFVLAAAGLYYMFRVMPLGVAQMRHIFAAWLVPISIGLAVSIVSARGWALTELVAHLGSFWLLVTAVGFVWNGVVDRPMRWYLVGAGLCVAGAALAYFNTTFLISQYLVAGVISAWAMLLLFVFRTD